MVCQGLSIHESNTKEENLDAIMDVVLEVNWRSVQRCMEFLKWTWAMPTGLKVPTVEELIKEVTSHCMNNVERCLANKKDYHTSCGGIEVLTKYLPDGSVCLGVMFVLEDADNY